MEEKPKEEVEAKDKAKPKSEEENFSEFEKIAFQSLEGVTVSSGVEYMDLVTILNTLMRMRRHTREEFYASGLNVYAKLVLIFPSLRRLNYPHHWSKEFENGLRKRLIAAIHMLSSPPPLLDPPPFFPADGRAFAARVPSCSEMAAEVPTADALGSARALLDVPPQPRSLSPNRILIQINDLLDFEPVNSRPAGQDVVARHRGRRNAVTEIVDHQERLRDIAESVEEQRLPEARAPEPATAPVNTDGLVPSMEAIEVADDLEMSEADVYDDPPLEGEEYEDV